MRGVDKLASAPSQKRKGILFEGIRVRREKKSMKFISFRQSVSCIITQHVKLSTHADARCGEMLEESMSGNLLQLPPGCANSYAD